MGQVREIWEVMYGIGHGTGWHREGRMWCWQRWYWLGSGAGRNGSGWGGVYGRFWWLYRDASREIGVGGRERLRRQKETTLTALQLYIHELKTLTSETLQGVTNVIGEKKKRNLQKSSPTNFISSSTSSFIFAKIQGLGPYITNKLPHLSGLINEANDVLASFTDTCITDYMDSVVWIPNPYTGVTEQTAHLGLLGMYVKDSLIKNELR